jgi:nitronate monooxygenase
MRRNAESLRRVLGIDFPIIQAPMAGVQGSALAAAVSNAGGLGSLPCAILDAGAMHTELTALGNATTAPFAVNFFCHPPPRADADRDARWRKALAPYYEELGVEPLLTSPENPRIAFNSDAADVLTAFKPRVVSFHFGLPSPDLVARVKSWGAKVLSTATTVEEALWLEARGVDVIVAQGAEAGGHRGMFLTDDLSTQIGTLALVPQIVRAVRVPVVAAGGIADARGVAAALELGAAGVQAGTAYLLCHETATGAAYRAALKSPSASHTALTNVFTGRPARAILNRLMREIGPMSAAAPEFPLAASGIMPLRAKAESAGSVDFSWFWAGQNTTGCKEVPAAALTQQLAEGLGGDA